MLSDYKNIKLMKLLLKICAFILGMQNVTSLYIHSHQSAQDLLQIVWDKCDNDHNNTLETDE